MSIYSSYITPHYVTLQTLIQMPRIKVRAGDKNIPMRETFTWDPIEDTDTGNECSLWSCSNQARYKRFDNLHLARYMYICSYHRQLDCLDLYTKQIIQESKTTKETLDLDKKEKKEIVHDVEKEDKNVINPKYVGGNGTRVWDPLKHQCSLMCLNAAAYKCYDPKISTYLYLCSFHYNKNEGKKYGYTPLTNEDKEREDKNVIKPEYTVVNGIIVYDPELLCNFADCRTIAIYKRKDEKRLIYHKLCYYHHSTNNKINDIIQSDYETIKEQGNDKEAVMMEWLTTGKEILIAADKRTKARARKNKHVNKTKTQIITRSEKKKQKLEAEADTEMEEEQGDYDLDCAF